MPSIHRESMTNNDLGGQARGKLALYQPNAPVTGVPSINR
jgi:hypothetical protein